MQDGARHLFLVEGVCFFSFLLALGGCEYLAATFQQKAKNNAEIRPR